MFIELRAISMRVKVYLFLHKLKLPIISQYYCIDISLELHFSTIFT